MKFYLICLIFLFNFSISQSRETKIIYTSPLPGSKFVNTSSNIIVRTDTDINPGDIIFIVNGTKSGVITGKVKFPDVNTIIFLPVNNFLTSETINVKLINRNNNSSTQIKDFNFETTSGLISENERKAIIQRNRNEEFNQDNVERLISRNFSDTTPADFPFINVSINQNPNTGKIFCTNILRGGNNSDPFLMILNNDGTPFFYRKMTDQCYDFKVQENGLLTYFQDNKEKFFALDSSYNIVDSFYTGNGYVTDLHDIRILPDGSVLLMSYDVQVIDMSMIVPGGQKDARVTGLILQRLDKQRNVVFQWRSWDNFQITDADSVNLSLAVIDYVHGNAIEIDSDGNYIISSRNMSEITKINKTTGDIIWRFGGKKNQFHFINDPIRFSYQHAIRRTHSGTFTLFDNGNFHTPKFSRAAEYKLDIANMTAELIWEYRNEFPIYTFAMGYAERLANGNTFISWGFAPVAFSEVNSQNTKLYEFSFDSVNFSYRTIRAQWNPQNMNQVPSEFVLTKNYPNPFNPSTKIYFSIPQNSHISITIYNVLGENIAELIKDDFYPAGQHIIIFNAANLPSGIYFYDLIVNGEKHSHKMVLTK